MIQIGKDLNYIILFIFLHIIFKTTCKKNYFKFFFFLIFFLRDNARFLWKRIPNSTKKAYSKELAETWNVGKLMWQRDVSSVYKILAGDWPNDLQPVVIALRGNWNKKKKN